MGLKALEKHAVCRFLLCASRVHEDGMLTHPHSVNALQSHPPLVQVQGQAYALCLNRCRQRRRLRRQLEDWRNIFDHGFNAGAGCVGFWVAGVSLNSSWEKRRDGMTGATCQTTASVQVRRVLYKASCLPAVWGREGDCRSIFNIRRGILAGRQSSKQSPPYDALLRLCLRPPACRRDS